MAKSINFSDRNLKIPRKRLITGALILILGHIIGPLCIPLITLSNWPAGIKAPLSGFLVVGFPQISTILAVIFLGKPGFAWIKLRVYGLLRRMAPPSRISRLRHRLGISLLILILLSNTLEPYISSLFPMIFYNRLNFAIAGDLLLLISVFILGGDFWDKLQALFIYSPPQSSRKKAEK